MRSAPASRSTRFPDFIYVFNRRVPTSVGRTDIADGDFRRAPLIAPNYLSTDKDELDVVHGGRLLQAIGAHRGHASVDPGTHRAPI